MCVSRKRFLRVVELFFFVLRYTLDAIISLTTAALRLSFVCEYNAMLGVLLRGDLDKDVAAKMVPHLVGKRELSRGAARRVLCLGGVLLVFFVCAGRLFFSFFFKSPVNTTLRTIQCAFNNGC